jgi:hypothetical protein
MLREANLGSARFVAIIHRRAQLPHLSSSGDDPALQDDSMPVLVWVLTFP